MAQKLNEERPIDSVKSFLLIQADQNSSLIGTVDIIKRITQQHKVRDNRPPRNGAGLIRANNRLQNLANLVKNLVIDIQQRNQAPILKVLLISLLKNNSSCALL